MVKARKRIKISNEEFNALADYAEVAKMDWFYCDYINRKTVDLVDLGCIEDSYLDEIAALYNRLPDDEKILLENLFKRAK